MRGINIIESRGVQAVIDGRQMARKKEQKMIPETAEARESLN